MINNIIYCRKCKNGWIFNNETEEVTKCLCLIKYQESIEKDSIIKNSNLPINTLSYDINSYIGPDKNNNIDKLKKYVNEFDEKFRHISLYISGNNSTQKTSVVSWVGLQLALKGFSVNYCLMNELVKDLSNLQFNDELNKKVDKYKSVDILIIDESMDLEKVTLYKSNYQIPFLNEFIKERIERNKKATIFISNVYLKEIDNIFGKSLKTMMERSCNELIFEDNINLIKNEFEVNDLWK